MQLSLRKSETRGGGDHGWLKTFHTFSFADYYDPAFEQFGCLRVMNEDRVDPSSGFPKHPHREAEIFSIILDGELSHRDSMGNVETMKRGDVQMTSGGTGIAHSEFNQDKTKQVHFLQVWAYPNIRGLTPRYATRHFTDTDKLDKLVTIVASVGTDGVSEQQSEAREGKGPTPIHAALYTLTSLLSPQSGVTHTLLPALNGKPGKKLYIHLPQTSGFNLRPSSSVKGGPKLHLIASSGGEVQLGEGDGVFIRGGKTGETIEIKNVGEGKGEVVVFEMDEE